MTSYAAGRGTDLTTGWATLRVGAFADANGNGAREAGEAFRPVALTLADASGATATLDLGLVAAPVSVRVQTAGGLYYLVAPALEAAPVEGVAPWVALHLAPGGTTEVLFAHPAEAAHAVAIASATEPGHGGDGAALLGTARAETLRGGDGADLARGLGGNDTLDGGAGDDTLDGGAGDDALLGGEGRDTLDGGAGADRLRGGAGADAFVFGAGDLAAAGSASLDTILDFAGAGDAGRNPYGDALVLEGFGAGAALAYARAGAGGAQVYQVTAAGGAAHEFALVSLSGARLGAGDYAFA